MNVPFTAEHFPAVIAYYAAAAFWPLASVVSVAGARP